MQRKWNQFLSVNHSCANFLPVRLYRLQLLTSKLSNVPSISSVFSVSFVHFIFKCTKSLRILWPILHPYMCVWLYNWLRNWYLTCIRSAALSTAASLLLITVQRVFFCWTLFYCWFCWNSCDWKLALRAQSHRRSPGQIMRPAAQKRWKRFVWCVATGPAASTTAFSAATGVADSSNALFGAISSTYAKNPISARWTWRVATSAKPVASRNVSKWRWTVTVSGATWQQWSLRPTVDFNWHVYMLVQTCMQHIG